MPNSKNWPQIFVKIMSNRKRSDRTKYSNHAQNNQRTNYQRMSIHAHC